MEKLTVEELCEYVKRKPECGELGDVIRTRQITGVQFNNYSELQWRTIFNAQKLRSLWPHICELKSNYRPNCASMAPFPKTISSKNYQPTACSIMSAELNCDQLGNNTISCRSAKTKLDILVEQLKKRQTEAESCRNQHQECTYSNSTDFESEFEEMYENSQPVKPIPLKPISCKPMVPPRRDQLALSFRPNAQIPDMQQNPEVTVGKLNVPNKSKLYDIVLANKTAKLASAVVDSRRVGIQRPKAETPFNDEKPLPKVPTLFPNAKMIPHQEEDEEPNEYADVHEEQAEYDDEGYLAADDELKDIYEPEPIVNKTFRGKLPKVTSEVASKNDKKLSIFNRPLPALPQPETDPRFNSLKNTKPRKISPNFSTLPLPPKLMVDSIEICPPGSTQPAISNKTNSNELKAESYFKDTDREGAESLLNNVEDGAFLIRPSRKYEFCLTIKDRNHIYNLGIIKENNKYKCMVKDGHKPNYFDSVQEMIGFYLANPIHVKNGDKHNTVYIRNLLPK